MAVDAMRERGYSRRPTKESGALASAAAEANEQGGAVAKQLRRSSRLCVHDQKDIAGHIKMPGYFFLLSHNRLHGKAKWRARRSYVKNIL